MEILNNDLDKELNAYKLTKLNIKAKTYKGELINIEIQIKNEYNMIQRTIYYCNVIYTNQLSSTRNYSELSRSIIINILNFKLLNNKNLTDIEEILFIELPKSKHVNKDEIHSIDSLLKFIEFIKDP